MVDWHEEIRVVSFRIAGYSDHGGGALIFLRESGDYVERSIMALADAKILCDTLFEHLQTIPGIHHRVSETAMRERIDHPLHQFKSRQPEIEGSAFEHFARSQFRKQISVRSLEDDVCIGSWSMDHRYQEWHMAPEIASLFWEHLDTVCRKIHLRLN